MSDMNTHILTLGVGLDRPIDEQAARDVAARWAARCGLALGVTSTGLDEPRLRVSGMATGDEAPPRILDEAALELVERLDEHGHEIVAWHTLEILDAAEVERRAAALRMPDVVNAEHLAALAGITRQRVYQLESERKAGRRADFPAPILEGYWLRTVAEHWASTRKTKPGPARRDAS